MPPKTNSDKVEELTRLAGQTAARLDLLEKQSEQTGKQLEVLREMIHTTTTRLAVAEQTVSDLKHTNQEWGRRGWQLFVPIATALIGAALGYALKR